MAGSTQRKKKSTTSRPAKNRSTVKSKPSKPAAKTRSKPKASPVAKRISKRMANKQQAPRLNLGSISPERKLDVVGVAMALIGLLLLLSLLSSSRGNVTGLLIAWLGDLAGWGSFILPIALIAIGLWLVFRNLEQLPRLSAERITGLVLLYLNLLTWLHVLSLGNFDTAFAMKGGGLIGASFQWLLMQAFGLGGTVVALIAWLLLALAFTFDVSIPELFQFARRAVAALRRPAASDQAGSTPEAVSYGPELTYSPPQTETGNLPPNFHPIHTPTNSRTPVQAAPTAQPASARNGGRKPPVEPVTAPQAQDDNAIQPDTGDWALPKIEEILDPPTPQAIAANTDKERAQLIETTLASFGAPAHVVDISRGPTVTQFGVEPDFIETRNGRTRVRVSKISNLADDLALALAAARIRIQAPVPGRSYVGIEVPNTEISRVTLREVMESEPFKKLRSPLRFGLGKDVAGKAAAYDLAAMPHLLIAGTTGSGKSVCVNAILSCFLLNNTPADLRMVLVDPKRVELTGYNGIPHLLDRVVTDAEKVIGALQWMLREMDSRYHRFSKEGVRNIAEYNTRHPAERLPYLVIVIDELADLMMLAPDETERSITRLAQLARATGIHMILATQRPSVDVLTGLIKANFPARIAFAVASGIDSRVILDQPGAERLLGRGDMLFQAPDASAPVRLQGVYVSDAETQRLVDTWRFSAARISITQPGENPEGAGTKLPLGAPLQQVPLWDMEEEEESDPLYKEAVELVRREGRASITMLQRRMRVGYTRAARLIDTMEDKGIVGPSQPNSQVREVLDYGPMAPPADE